jgi:DNA (cytosine-5)-methyltransferase 1
MGYHRAGFEVVGVDIKPQPHYPFEFHQADALTYPLDGFDAYHASPPCQAYSRSTNKQRKYEGYEYPELIPVIRERLRISGRHYVIENVVGSPLETCIILRGDMFGLKVVRPRLFEVSFMIFQPQIKKLANMVCGKDYFRVMKGGLWLEKGETRGTFSEWKDAMGIDWTGLEGLSQAIPPAYTEYIGKYLMKVL